MRLFGPVLEGRRGPGEQTRHVHLPALQGQVPRVGERQQAQVARQVQQVSRLGMENPLGMLADGLGTFGPWALLGLAALAVLGFVLSRSRNPRTPAS